MRIRSVKPDYWRDRLLARLKADVREFYIGLWMEADDAGWLRWQPEEIAADLYPYRPAHVRERQVTDWGAKYVELGRLVIHPCGHAHVVKLTKHQRFGGKLTQTILAEHESACAPPPSAEAPHRSAPVRTVPRVSTTVGEVKVGKGKGGTRDVPPRGTNGAKPTTTSIDESIAMAGDSSKSDDVRRAARRAVERHAPERLGEIGAAS